MFRHAPLFATAFLLLAGCAREQGSYPSLAPRPIEKLGFAEPAAAAPAVAIADPTLEASLAAIASRLKTVGTGFDADAAKAQAAARRAKGQSVGSDSWLDAQAALAVLDDWRAQASTIVTDLDSLASARAAQLAPDYPALAALRDRAQAEVDRQAGLIESVQSALPDA
ncbi:hypothetical protein ACT009_00340 [Sphingomonas sp. Tas61C01]|uniref:hypothetical protein n=1 Tax=Sphingomonas sp. Tas61C01 TaxID=3458297 RepID=UPI00403ECA2C